MKGVILTIAIIVLALLVLTYPFKIKGVVHIDVFNNVAFAVVKVFDFKLFSAKFQIIDGKLDIDKKKKKKKNKDKRLVHYYFKSLVKRINLKKFELMFDAGIEEDAFLSSMICGYMQSIVAVIYALVQDKFKSLRSFSYIQPHYKENVLELSGLGVISFSLLDMLLSLLSALINKYKEK